VLLFAQHTHFIAPPDPVPVTPPWFAAILNQGLPWGVLCNDLLFILHDWFTHSLPLL
jgi:hypothetical protein